MAKQTILLLAFFSLLFVNLYAQEDQKTMGEAIHEIIAPFADDQSPGMAVGVVEDGVITHEFYLGNANLDHMVKVNESTRFNIASNCKQFTALMILKLAEEGKLQLEEDFRQYIPDVLENIESPITIAQLISHTSGVRDVYDLWALTGKSWWQLFIDNDDAIELLATQTALNFEPGTDFLYSNSNYLLLAKIVEAVTEERFSDYAKAMFVELGMEETEFLRYYSLIIPNQATAYGDWGSGWRECPNVVSVHGDGALYTTLPDQLKWEQIIQNNDGSYFTQAFIEQSQSPIDRDYGFGTVIGETQGYDYVFHNGATCAYNANFLRFPSERLSIVVMANGIGATSEYLAWQIARLYLEMETGSGAYAANPSEIEQLSNIEDVVGNYQHEDGTVIRISLQNDTLYREMYQRDPVKLIPEEGGLFEYETIAGLKMNFENIGTADQQFTLYKSTQAPSTYRKLPNTELSGFEWEALNGSYNDPDTGTEIILKYRGDNLYALTKNGREREAELFMRDNLRMNSYNISILRDDNGKVIGLNVNNNRIQNVIFDRN